MVKSMHKLAKVLKFLLERHQLTETELSRRINLGQPVIHRIASGETRNPKLETLSPIANYFQISINQLIGDEPLPLVHNELSDALPAQLRSVPLLSWDQVSHWPKLKKMPIGSDCVYTDLVLSQQGFAVKVQDTTMRPRFPEETLLLVEPEIKPTDRSYVIFKMAHKPQAVFRQFFTDGNSYYLNPMNPAFEKLVIGSEDICLGVVVQIRTDLI